MSASETSGSGLPGRFPIFPLTGALLLPGGNLPLNIFEPRYLEMTRHAMQTEQVIGMIQSTGVDDARGRPAIYDVGCAGKITSFEETADGRYLITLTGLSRFRVVQELDVTTPYRQIIASYAGFAEDIDPKEPEDHLRMPLISAVRRYFEAKDIRADWDAINQAPLPGLVTSLSMICPFEPSEKQALLEAEDAGRRARTLIALLEMGAAEGAASDISTH
ncbi:MAG: LON peptidase substrate-binding domain-containing protein [Geminicoccaceae bacterium]